MSNAEEKVAPVQDEKNNPRDIIKVKCKDYDYLVKNSAGCWCLPCNDIYHFDNVDPKDRNIDNGFFFDRGRYDLLLDFCVTCGSTENLKACSKCSMLCYCCREHQVMDWGRHKRYCGMQKQASDLSYHSLVLCHREWRGFLHLKPDVITDRLQYGEKLYTLIQRHDSKVVGASDETIDDREKQINHFKILGVFSDLERCRKVMKISANYVAMKEVKYFDRVSKTPGKKLKIQKIGPTWKLCPVEQYSIDFQILPFIVSRNRVKFQEFQPSNFLSFNKSYQKVVITFMLCCLKTFSPLADDPMIEIFKWLSSYKEYRIYSRMNVLISYYWTDTNHYDCFRVVDFFGDLDEATEYLTNWYQVEMEDKKRIMWENNKMQKVDFVENEKRTIFKKFKPDRSHNDLIGVQVDKVYHPYILSDLMNDGLDFYKAVKNYM